MKYRIITTRTKYLDGYHSKVVQEKFPKVFESQEEAEKFGHKFFEPPTSVEKWTVEEMK